MDDFALPMKSSRKVLGLSLFGLVVYLAFEVLLLCHFIRVDTRPPSWDQATHMEIALDYREAIGEGHWSDAWFLAPKPGMPPFPPAYHLLLRGVFNSSDPAHAALWLNWFYLAMLAFSLFGIAWRFLPDARAIAATLAFCAAPAVQDLLTTQLVELAVVALVAAGYWALLESEEFTAWLPSLAFGVLYAVGMMHKWSYFSYMIPAYWIAGRALGHGSARLKVFVSAALSLALFTPWYLSHLALLPSRLLQASSDFAIPFWREGAWATYLKQACGGLGPPLWGFGLIGILAPQFSRRKEQGWILIWWSGLTYAFWTLVPNRQLRFLLPGLAPFGLFLVATWPKSVSWGVVFFQLVASLNFFFGALKPMLVSTPLLTLPFFTSRPPVHEDWKIENILRRIESTRDPSRAVTNVTLVANDDYFNAPTFHWVQRELRLPHARMRGVNKRLCELSEFVLLKEGRLGPASVIGGLPAAAQEIADPRGWFRRGYEEISRWPLPDGSAAVLYRQRRKRGKPVSNERIAADVFAAGEISGAGLRVNLSHWQRGPSAREDAHLKVEQLSIRGLKVHHADVAAKNFSFVTLSQNDVASYDLSEMRLMRLDRLAVRHLEVDVSDLKNFLEKRIAGLKLKTLVLDRTIKAEGTWNGHPVAVEAGLDLDVTARQLKVSVLSASFLGVPMPLFLFRPIKELKVPLDPSPETPFFIDLPGLTIKGGRLTVP